MPTNDLLTPKIKGWSTWIIFAVLTSTLFLCIWQVKQDRYLSRDSLELTYLDILLTTGTIYHVGLALIRFSLASISSFIKTYGIKPSLLYLGYVTILSCVLIYLLDIAALGPVHVARYTIVDRLESSVVEIVEKRGPIKQRHMTGVVPYSIEEHTKYSGEDAVFKCYRLLSFNEDVHSLPDQVVWEKDGKVVFSSDHINITWKFENFTESVHRKDELRHYLVSSKLIVTFIDLSDFGNYSCLVKNMASVKQTKNVSQKSLFELRRLLLYQQIMEEYRSILTLLNEIIPSPVIPLIPTISQQQITKDRTKWKDDFNIVKGFSLVRMKAHTRLVHAPPGGLVSFSATYDQLGEIDDVWFDYTIGSKSFDGICSGYTRGCSLSVAIYWYFFHKGGHIFYYYSTIRSIRMTAEITGTGWQCVCKNSYNYHEFWFYRRIYNKTSEREEIRQVKYPHSVILAPRFPDLFFYNFTGKVDPVAKEPCWIKKQQAHIVSSCKQEEEAIEWMLWFFLQIEMYVMIIIGLLITYLVVFISKLMTKQFIIPIRNKILEGSFYRCRVCAGTGRTLGWINEEDNVIKHDVFISYADKSLLAAYQLSEQLKSYGVSAFLSDLDILGGQLKTEAVSDAIASSRRFVVILNQEYIDSGMQNRFEFQLILRKVLKKTCDNRNLLILRQDKSKVPDILKQFCILDWTANIELDEKLRCLKKWSEGNVQGGIICAC